jgi:two-component system, NarL family, nitrate/nitrite response regulator NarL
MTIIGKPVDSAQWPRTVRPARVVIADDECMFRACLRQLLAVPPSVVKDCYSCDVGAGFEVVGEASSGQDTVDTVKAMKPDMLLLDISMPRMTGLEALRDLQRSVPETKAIILSGTLDKSQLLTAVQWGARGLVPKDSATEQLFEAMVYVMAGQSWIARPLVTDLMDVLRTRADAGTSAAPAQPFGLTPREREVLTFVVQGCGNKEIAQRLAVSEETIKHHLTRMFDKVGAANRLELALAATRNDLVN